MAQSLQCWARWRCSRWSEVSLHWKISKDNDVDRNITEGRFKACDHSEWQKCEWRSLLWDVSEGRTANVYRREISWRRISLLCSPGSNTLRAWHCSVSGRGRSGHPETRWQPFQRAPVFCPIEDFWGVMKQEAYRGGWVVSSEGKPKRRIDMALNKIDLRT